MKHTNGEGLISARGIELDRAGVTLGVACFDRDIERVKRLDGNRFEIRGDDVIAHR